MIRFISIIFIVSLICCAKAKDEFDPETPNDYQIADYHNLSKRLAEQFTYGGYGVVTLDQDGNPAHQGEALIWGGTSLWSIPCGDGKAISDAMAAMIESNEGQLLRVDPLGEYAGGREITLDGAIGAMLGISRRISDCGESRDWRNAIDKMITFQNSHADRLHSNVESKLVGEFKYIRELIAYKVGLRDEPDEERLRDLEKIVGGWAFAVQAAHTTGQGSDACFRINLGLSTFLTAETLGKGISQGGRNQFCSNTKGMDIPTVDHWCGRKSMSEYLENYDENKYEYRHQRCGEPWEHQDGNGNISHQLDKIVGYVFTNDWHSMQN